MGKVGWSDLPEELVDLISNRLSSNIGLVRFRSICKPWRSAVATKKRFLNRFKRNLRPFNRSMTELIPTTLFRITLPYSSSSCPKKGWLIKTRQDTESSKILLLSPLSHQLFTRSNKTLDLFKVGVSDIHQSYSVRYLNNKRDTILHDLSRVVFVDNLVFVVDYKNQIWCCKSGGQSSKWTRIKNEDVGDFSDVILHRGHVYALDLKGAIWWISLSELNISQYGPSTPIEYYEIDDCKDKRLVDYCGDVCVVHRFCKKFRVNWYDVDRTVNFKVYKMDKELVEWVEISSLEDKALIVALDSCFTVVASEYHGCLENAIYFNDGDDGYKFRKGVNGEGVKVFKLDDRSIINTIDSSSESCLEMFSPPFWKD